MIHRARRSKRNRIGGRLSLAAGGNMRAPRVVAMLAGGLRADPSDPPEPICGVARRSATLVLRNERPVRGTGVEPPRTADLLSRIFDHFLPLGDPADGTGDGE